MENEISSSTPERIRRRVSYREYAELAALLVNDHTVEELATWFHNKLDERRAYGSETNAGYAFESLRQFLKDFNAKRKISELFNGSDVVMAIRVISKDYPNEKKCPGCNWETSTLYSLPQNDIDEEGLCVQCFMEMIVETEMKIIRKIIRQDTKICNECGESVAPGSGKFVNRIPDFDTYEERLYNGKTYPHGEFLCAECDSKFREVEE